MITAQNYSIVRKENYHITRAAWLLCGCLIDIEHIRNLVQTEFVEPHDFLRISLDYLLAHCQLPCKITSGIKLLNIQQPSNLCRNVCGGSPGSSFIMKVSSLRLKFANPIIQNIKRVWIFAVRAWERAANFLPPFALSAICQRSWRTSRFPFCKYWKKLNAWWCVET
jgi:hypothetical protein